ncbi:pterin-4-alpha-carbinolamine dehydratase [Cellvibrio zantedeschiae]|uniref:Putative pterin-4-alpha-carbinolamine dehydratase n=1 Tax=Cellvibrio zantedeschiae TaxID=1237077 RepID=A0ABQ3AXC3_9GAMM|nr:pterin-4-alpha-carbinolamine dehydratase [Cellvibrio zantedeschiae]
MAQLINELSEKTCSACRVGAPLASATEIADVLNALPHWSAIEVDGIQQLTRIYKFKNFVAALEFTNLIGAVAEEYGHHPALLTEWGKVTVNWWTHKIKGLHENDLIMAAKTEKIFQAIDSTNL